SLDDALARVEGYLGSRTPRSIALIANAAAILPELVRRDVRVDVVTDQTSAHDPLDGYVPDVKSPALLRINDPSGYIEASHATIARSGAGSPSPRSVCRSRACRPGCAGSGTASAPRSARGSTRWCGPASSRHRSSSDATTSTRAPSRHRTARPRECATGATRSP